MSLAILKRANSFLGCDMPLKLITGIHKAAAARCQSCSRSMLQEYPEAKYYAGIAPLLPKLPTDGTVPRM